MQTDIHFAIHVYVMVFQHFVMIKQALLPVDYFYLRYLGYLQISYSVGKTDLVD